MSKSIRVIISFLIILSFVSADLSFAQEEGRVIITIRVKNNKAISEATILSKIKSKPGARFSQDVLNDDLKRLYALGYFSDVSIDVEDYEEGTMVTIVVEEKPVIEEIEFAGNKKISARRLKKEMQIKEGGMLDYSKLSEDINGLKELYKKQGFQDIEIVHEIKTDKENNMGTILIKIDEKQRIRIKKIYVKGNESVKEKIILGMMRTKPAWLFRKGYFDDEIFASDIEKLTRYYQSLGFLDAAINASFDYADNNESMFIALTVEEGKRYTVGKIKIGGKIVFPESMIREKISMVEGEPFSYGVLGRDIEEVRGLYYTEGYMNVGIEVDRNIDPKTNKVDVDYSIDSHDIVYVGKVDITGNVKTKDIVIRRELRIYPGERFDGDKIRRSKERLYNLGFFEDVYFDTVQTSDPNVRDLVVSVKESKTGEFAFGGGYSSVDQFIGFVQVTQRNFDLFNFPHFTGDGQNLSIKANIGTIRSDYELSWTEPWIFDYPVSFGFDAYRRAHSRSSNVGYGYKEARTGGDIRLGKEFMEYFNVGLMYKLEEVNISDLADNATPDLAKERGENWLSAVRMDLTYDMRDNIYNPTKGFLAQTILENAGGFLGFDKDFYKGFLLGSYYYTIPNTKIVLELKGRTGVCQAYGDDDEVPIYERFYAGGVYTIRGYGERRVGPRDAASSTPIGGEAMMVGNVEATFPVYEKIIKGAVFYDVGNVWADIGDYGQGDFKQGVGTGIRVKTPIGPLKLDVGYPLNDNHDDKKELEWYFSMTHGW